MEDGVGSGTLYIPWCWTGDSILKPFRDARQCLFFVADLDGEEPQNRDLSILSFPNIEGLGDGAEQVEYLFVVDLKERNCDPAIMSFPLLRQDELHCPYHYPLILIHQKRPEIGIRAGLRAISHNRVCLPCPSLSAIFLSKFTMRKWWNRYLHKILSRSRPRRSRPFAGLRASPTTWHDPLTGHDWISWGRAFPFYWWLWHYPL